MDVRDIRYLHDDAIKEDDEVGDELSLPPFLTRKNILSSIVILFLLSAIGLVLFNINTPLPTNSSAQIPQDTPMPTPQQVQVTGKVKCVSSVDKTTDQCQLGIISKDGKTYSLENVQYADVSSGALSPGKEVTVNGVLDSGGTGGSGGASGNNSGNSGGQGGTIFLSTSDGGGAVQDQTTPTSTPSVQSPQPSPTLTPTVTITPTPSLEPVS